MLKKIFLITIIFLPFVLSGQEKSLEALLSDSSMQHSSVSMCILNATTGETIYDLNPEKCLVPASVQKVFSSIAALELLGPGYSFRTIVGYTGSLDKTSGRLNGDIIIKGGGDPALGSKYFKEHYGDFISKWITAIKNTGIKKIEGKIITDDSYYDFEPVPGKWLWEDTGNYYGSGAYGLSVFDNTYEIHLNTASGSPLITKIVPEQCKGQVSNYLRAEGNADKGYVFATPYSAQSWLSGTIPEGKEDFILKAAITDPPLLLAQIIDKRLRSENIAISGNPSTARLEKLNSIRMAVTISVTVSPVLKDIISVLNHESVNLFAEHLTRELGRFFKNAGSTTAGIEVINQFMKDSGVYSDGLYLEDGSGLSPMNAVSSGALSDILLKMKAGGRFFNEFYASLPEAGHEGTLKNYFRDPVFENNLRAKSGSMTRVMSYAGYFRTSSGNDIVFSIIINNYSGQSGRIVSGIEGILKETILNK